MLNRYNVSLDRDAISLSTFYMRYIAINKQVYILPVNEASKFLKTAQRLNRIL